MGNKRQDAHAVFQEQIEIRQSPSQKKKSGSLNSEVNMQSQKGSTQEMRQLAQGKEILIDSETDIAIAPKSKQCAAVPPDHVKREARTVYLNPKCYPL